MELTCLPFCKTHYLLESFSNTIKPAIKSFFSFTPFKVLLSSKQFCDANAQKEGCDRPLFPLLNPGLGRRFHKRLVHYLFLVPKQPKVSDFMYVSKIK